MDIQKALAKIDAAERLLQEAKILLTASQQPLPSSPIPEETSDEAISITHDINTVDGIVAQLLDIAAQQSNDTEAEIILDKITHVTIDSKAMASMMRFNWARLKAQVQDYLKTPSDPYSFTIVREQERSTGNIAEKKIFLEASGAVITYQDPQLTRLTWVCQGSLFKHMNKTQFTTCSRYY